MEWNEMILKNRIVDSKTEKIRIIIFFNFLRISITTTLITSSYWKIL